MVLPDMRARLSEGVQCRLPKITTNTVGKALLYTGDTRQECLKRLILPERTRTSSNRLHGISHGVLRAVAPPSASRPAAAQDSTAPGRTNLRETKQRSSGSGASSSGASSSVNIGSIGSGSDSSSGSGSSSSGSPSATRRLSQIYGAVPSSVPRACMPRQLYDLDVDGDKEGVKKMMKQIATQGLAGDGRWDATCVVLLLF